MSNVGFCCLANPGIVSMGLLGFEPKNSILKKHLDEYYNRHFLKDDGTYDLTTNVTRFSELLKKYGLGNEDKLYNLNDLLIVYPTDYFYPTDFSGNRSNFTSNTCTVHLHAASWLPRTKRIRIFVSRKFQRIRSLLKKGKK